MIQTLPVSVINNLPMENVAEVEMNDFATFFHSQYIDVFRYTAWIMHDRARAAEVTQEAFVRAYLKWDRLSRSGYANGWVRKVAVRLAIKTKIREQRSESVAEFKESSIFQPDQSENTQLRLDMEWAVAHLPRVQKAAVMLFYFLDLPVERVSEELGCRQSTTKVHLHRAREKLRELLRQRGYESFASHSNSTQ